MKKKIMDKRLILVAMVTAVVVLLAGCSPAKPTQDPAATHEKLMRDLDDSQDKYED
jgi:hypothetical protein